MRLKKNIIKIVRRFGKIINTVTKKKFREYRIKKIKKSPIDTKDVYSQKLYYKQYIRFYYLIKERTLKKYINQAFLFSYKKLSNYLFINNNIVSILYNLLESRLDIILVNCNFCKTLFEARQKILHGFVFVNNKRITSCSFFCKPKMIIEIKEEIKIPLINLNLHLFEYIKNKTIRVINYPSFYKKHNIYMFLHKMLEYY